MTKWVNIAHKNDVPSLVNIDKLIRIYPGWQGSGKDASCTLVFGFAIFVRYDDPSDNAMEEYDVQVYLPISEVIRRMREELLII